jgi:hypothetical protein
VRREAMTDDELRVLDLTSQSHRQLERTRETGCHTWLWRLWIERDEVVDADRAESNAKCARGSGISGNRGPVRPTVPLDNVSLLKRCLESVEASLTNYPQGDEASGRLFVRTCRDRHFN